MYEELLPPWLKYPELKFRSMGWRMGYGEEYWNLFSEWFSKLSESNIYSYIKKYPEPNEWKGFYKRKLDYLYPNNDFEI